MLRRIKKTNLKRMISTYQISYCKDMVAKFTGEPIESSFENQLLEYSQKLYEPESRSKISPPLPGTRKVFGYIRPSWNYIPLTNYQYNFGRTAYEILKRNLKRGAEALRNPQSGENDNPVVDGEEKKKHEIAEATCDCRCCVKKLKKKNKCS
ncbi:hypothetical protein Zmor_010470 [Zophobas morio]|uniref:Uncharacterized protein n=2 Tax=Zophobas morio TaxID=2755281 RepID=A0AA38MJV8_9CUCU|nr:hypothetical protein Zmor_010470 [Zophobas morio]